MTITFDLGTAMVDDVDASSFTFGTHTVAAGSNRFLRGTSTWSESAASPTNAATGGTWNGVALTVVPSSKVHIALGDAVNSIGMEQYGLVAPDVGNFNLVFNYSGTVTGVRGGADSWFGVAPTTPYRAATVGNAADTTTTINVASAVGEVAVSSALILTVTALVSGDTERWNTTNIGNTAGGGSSQVGAASVTMDWSGAFGTPYNWIMSGMSLLEAAPGVLVRQARPFLPGARKGEYPIGFRAWNITGVRGAVVVAADDPFFQTLDRIEQGRVTITAAGLGGVIEE